MSLVVLAPCVLAGGCDKGRAGVLLQLSVESEDARPEYVLIDWTDSEGVALPQYRFPAQGALGGEGTELGSVFMDLTGQPAGMRTVTLQGMRGLKVFSRWTQSISWSGGKTTLNVLLQTVRPPDDGGVVERDGAAPPDQAEAGTDTPPARDVAGEGPVDRPPDMMPVDVAVDVAVPDVPPDTTPDTPAVNLQAGLALHWKFDETTGTTAADSSGLGLTGALTGLNASVPARSTDVPPGFSNTSRSLVFTSSPNRHAVIRDPLPASLKPAKIVSFSVWYRSSAVVGTSANLLAGGETYTAILRKDLIDIVKRTATTSTKACSMTVAGSLDNKWHHVAGVIDGASIKGYVDGVERCSLADTTNLFYEAVAVFAVGRSGSGGTGTTLDYDGSLDDVRVYTRALAVDDVKALAAGAQ